MSTIVSMLAQSNSGGAGAALFGGGMFIVILVIGLACLAFWLWMLVDLLTSSRPTNEKILWLLVLLLANTLGAIVYFFVARKGSASRSV